MAQLRCSAQVGRLVTVPAAAAGRLYASKEGRCGCFRQLYSQGTCWQQPLTEMWQGRAGVLCYNCTQSCAGGVGWVKFSTLQVEMVYCSAAGGDAHLGGDDWDAAIVQWLQRNYLQPAGVDTTNPSMAARLKALAEYAKVSLSDSEQVVLRCVLPGCGCAQGTGQAVGLCHPSLAVTCSNLGPGCNLEVNASSCAVCTVFLSPCLGASCVWASGLSSHCAVMFAVLQDACWWPQRWSSAGQLEPSTV